MPSPSKVQRRLGAAVLLLAALAVAAVFFLNRSSPAPAEVDRAALVSIDGRLHQAGQPGPFSGWMIERYPKGALKSRSALVEGRLHGVAEGWHENGQLEVREFFDQGVSHGLRVRWYSDGQKMSETEIVHGVPHGLFRRWHENGALSEEIRMRDGQPDGLALSFHPDGSLKSKAKPAGGKVLEQQFWNIGEHRLESAPEGS